MCFDTESPVARVHPSECAIFGEPEDDAHLIRLSGARWSSWGGPVARATAIALPNKPTEAEPVSVTITLSGLRSRCHGLRFYTKLATVKTSGTSNWFNVDNRRALTLSGACHQILSTG